MLSGDRTQVTDKKHNKVFRVNINDNRNFSKQLKSVDFYIRNFDITATRYFDVSTDEGLIVGVDIISIIVRALCSQR